MTTSHDHDSHPDNPGHNPGQAKSTLSPPVDHWGALTAVLPADSVAELDSWFDDQLHQLEQVQQKFVTKQSLRKNLRG
jgi:hypothetical protein